MKNFLLFLSITILLSINSLPQTAVLDEDFPVTNGTIYSIAFDENYTYLAGSFNYVGPSTGNGAKLSTNGNLHDTSFPRVNDLIKTIIPDGNGGWYIGGRFTKVGTVERNRVARINADGSVHSWNPNSNGDVNVILMNGSDIYVGGEFTTIGGLSLSRLAKLNNSTGEAISGWAPNPDGKINSLVISGSDLFIGGEFYKVGGFIRKGIAKLYLGSGAVNTSWSADVDGYINRVAVSGSDVYAAGNFSSIGGQAIEHIAKLNYTSGTVNASWNANSDSYINEMVINGSDIYVGGTFYNIGGQSRQYFAKLFASNGQADLQWNPVVDLNANSIVIDGSYIYLGGSFTTINGQSKYRIARLNISDGSVDNYWNPSASGSINTIAISQSEVCIGGEFNSVSGISRNGIVRVSNSTNLIDESWNPNPNTNSNIYSIFIKNADIYVGGTFTSIGGTSIGRLAKLNSYNSSADVNWNPGATGDVNVIVVKDNDIYVGGNFTSIGGSSRMRIAKLDAASGTANSSWNPTANGRVRAISIYNNEIYVGGDFTFIGGYDRNKLAKLNDTNGAADLNWNPNPNNAIYTLAVDESNVFVGGAFTSIDSYTINRLAKLYRTSGNVDNSWIPAPNNTVYSMLLDGNDLYVGGDFLTIGSQTINYFSKLDKLSGSSDTNFDLKINSRTHEIKLKGNNLFLAGFFNKINNSPQKSVAKFELPPKGTITITDPNGGNKLRVDDEYYIQWFSENVNAVDLDYSTDNGATWISIATNQLAGDGNYLWQVPNTPSNQCKIRIKDSYGTAYDISDDVFQIINASLQIIQPNGGETLNAGSYYEIKWSSADVEQVNLVYSTDNGVNWNYIATTSALSGSYQWLVPNTPSNRCKIFIEEFYYGVGGKESIISDTSDNVFVIELNPCPDLPSITYEGKTYNTVQIGDQCWLRENLNVGVMINSTFNQTNNSLTEKYCYENDTSNCNTYGGLYQWNEVMQYSTVEGAKGICPDGWHIPTLAEFQTLANTVENNGNALKAIGQGDYPGEGTNTSGFSALFAGARNSDGSFSFGAGAYMWSSSEYTPSNGANYLHVNTYDSLVIIPISDSKNYGFSVRCLKDEDVPDTLTILTPNGGEEWVGGTLYSIEWTTNLGPETVVIELSTNSGDSWSYIGQENANMNYFEWTPPTISSTGCLIRILVQGEVKTVAGDTTDNVFRIVKDSIDLGLIAYYPFTGDHFDYSGYNNNGTNNGVTLTEDRFGNATSAYYFPGNEWISVPSSTTLNGITNGLTLSAWIKPEELANQNILNKWFDDSANDRGFFINTNSTGNPWIGIIDDLNTVSSTKSLVRNRWQYVVGTWDGSYLNLYIDGKLSGSYQTTGTFVNQDVVMGIGADPNPGPKNFFNGRIDDIRIYNRGLSQDEIESLYRQNEWEDAYIQVFSPNNEENIEAGTSYDITWERFNVENVKIEYSTNSGAEWLLINSSVPAFPSTYEWIVPNTLSDECLVRITDVYDPQLADTSGMFEIYQRSITVLAPNGGEELKAGTNYYISWESSYIDNVDIKYSTNNGDTWLYIAGSISADEGSYVWNVPDSPSENCLIKISESSIYKNEFISDQSDSVFTIYKPSISILTPNGGEEWRVDNTYSIEWNSSHLEFVGIEYSTDAGLNWDFLDVVLARNGYYDWTIPNTPSDQCIVRIYESGGGTIGQESVISDTSDNVFTIYNPSLTVLEPNGGEEWRVGNSYQITWNNSHIDYIGIEYSTDSGATWEFITQTSASSGYFDWTIPDTPSDECKIKIYEMTGEVKQTESFVSDTSDGLFRIYKPTLTLSSPNGGEEWRVASQQYIYWSSSDMDYIDIEYSTDNGNSWDNITNSVPASNGNYLWNVPDTPSEECLIKLSESSGGGVSKYLVYDISDSVFTIFKPSITVVTPNGDESWRTGNNYSIEWTSYYVSSVKLEYTTDNGENWIYIDDAMANSGSYEWTVPDTPSDQCKVKITDNYGTISKGNAFDISDNVFEIYKPSITLIQPNGGEEWRFEETYSIDWTSNKVDYVSIEYSTNNGLNWNLITSMPASIGTYNWIIPDTPSDQCLVRIIEQSEKGITAGDTSDAVFTIFKPLLTIITPNGSNQVEVRKEFMIQWAADKIPYIDIYYTTNDGTSWESIVNAYSASTQYYTWTVPNTPSVNCRIMITEAGVKDGIMSDTSDAVFTIFDPERDALISFFNNTNGTNWNNKTNWNTYEPLASWYGVTVTEDRVTGLELINNNLSGVIPSSFEALTELTDLVLQGNSLTGWYPPAQGTFTKLIYLDLSQNQLTGNIPESFFSFTALRHIYLNQNNLTGSIPALFGNLVNLTNLNLANNQLSGTIPLQLLALTTLKELNLSGNQLSGSIPTQIGNLFNLEVLNLGGNQFSDSIPPQVGALVNLKYLQLGFNQLTGTIPNGIWNLSTLTTLDLSKNELSGSIPIYINGIIFIDTLDVSSNQLNGEIPTQIGNLSKLRFLSLADNDFDGALPIQTASLTNLKQLNVAKNNFTDLPALNALTNLQQLYIQENKLTFEDIEPNINVASVEFVYSPQADVGETIDTIAVAGSQLVLKMKVGGINNFYQWKKNGEVIQNANDTIYVIPSVSISDTGSYTCDITNTLATALTLNSYPIKVALQERIELTAPVGGEKLRANSSFNITWSLEQFKSGKNNEQNGTVKIELSTDAGQTWGDIAASLPMTDQMYNWTVPYLASGQCLIKITDNEYPQNSDISDSVFTVYIPSLTVITPNGGEFYPVSKQRTISWVTENVNFVKLAYSTDNGGTWIDFETWLPASPNNYTWTIPNKPSGECKIRIYDAEADEFFDTSDSAVTIIIPTITVTSPNGGEDWQVNLPYNITWTSDFVDSVAIEYTTDNGQSWISIIPSVTAANGTYNWLIPNTPSTQSKVRVFDAANSSFGDTSDNAFRIFQPEIIVTSPNGGENWQVNLPYNITWTSSDVADVKIEYSTNHGQSWIEIAASVPASQGSYQWLVPNTPSTEAKVKITNIAFPDISDISNDIFRIFLPEITVSSPIGGEDWQVNTQKTITWTSADVANVKIDYSTDNGLTWLNIVPSIPAVPASYEWTIPNTPSTQAKVRITDVAFPDIGDTSDNVFRIFLPEITVISPNGGENWQVNLPYNITWTSVDVANVKIDYSTDNGLTWLNVVASVPAIPTSYEWTIPNTPSLQTKVRVTDASFPDIGDTSDNVFRIFLPEITVTSPNGGENWQVNLPQTITWTSVDVANVKIDYSTDNGLTWLNVTASVPAVPASYQWEVPNTPSSQALVRITDVAFPDIGDTSNNVFRIFRPGVTVTSPNGGEQWQIGTTKNITWVSADVVNVKIDFSTNNGASWSEVIASTVAEPGSFPWVVPDTESDQCLIRIIDLAFPEYADTSDASFRIFIPKVTVNSPNGGEQWQVGQPYNITWTSSDMANIKIEYTTNSGSNWMSITASTATAPGSYSWTIPNTPSQLCKVRITDVANPTIGDSSDALFRIFLPALTVATPNGAEQWKVGTQQNITWTSADVANVKLEYTTNNGTTWNNIVNSVPAVAASYAWTIPNTPSTQCKVRITNVAFPNIGDTSDNVFRIFLPAVAITSPNGGEQWQANTQRNITWTSSDVMNVKLEYSTNDGTNWITITNSTPASPAVFAWTVPAVPSTQCKIRITDVSTPSIADVSDNVFTIFLPVITVLSPNGTERWLSGSVQTVNYTSQHVDTVAIEYSTNSGQSWIPVGASPATGQYMWTIPNTPSENCKIRVMHKSNYSIGDTSNAVFAIYSPAVTVISPNGGEQWLIGSQQLIKWTSKDIDTLRIELSTNNGVSWISVIDKTTAASGEYSWKVPDISSEQCMVRLTDVAVTTIRDVSNNVFAIFKPKVTILKPLGGEKFKVGTKQLITWTSSNSQNVKIEYTSDSGLSWNVIVESVAASATSYQWSVPNTPSSDCKIRITDVIYPAFGDTTDLSFAIVAPSMEVLSPNGKEKLIVGTWVNIKWTSYFVDSLRIEYSYDNGTNWLPIAQSVIADTGTVGFSWLVPETPSQQCLVRIFDLALPSFGDTSNLTFTIFKPTVTLISPNGGEKYFVGIAYDITWNSSEVDTVKLEYSVNDGSTWITIAEATPAETGVFNWIIPNTPSIIGKVRITDVRFIDVTDRSDDNFTIAVVQLPIYVAIHQNPALTRYCDIVVISDSLLESAPFVEARSAKDTIALQMNSIANSNYAYTGAYKFDSTGVYSFYIKIKAAIGVEKDTVRNFAVVLAKPGMPVNVRSLDLIANLYISPEVVTEETFFVAGISQENKETSYIFSPGRTFAQPVPLEITYSPSQISDPSKLFIYHYEEGGWIPLRSQVYPKTQQVKSYVSSLGKFKIEVDESFTGNNIVPDVYSLYQNYPNPFNPQTTIEFDLREDAVTSLIIYDILGRQVKTIYNDFQLAGRYRIQWDGRNDYNETVASGIYFYRLRSGEFISVKKMVLIR
jgi:uncharacterized protein (TIGR02145 family)